jgi:hypothetical protein
MTSEIVGKDVKVTVKKNPSTEAAKKTLVRIWLKDATHKRRARTMQQVRKKETVWHKRGGRQWPIRPEVILPNPKPGNECKIRVTPDVLNDLNSVEKFVEIETV